ncbi:MAG TPA: sigma-70 family RNA polymerase sigma factor [Pedobacter sp.]|uniref:RNA polymerase sigma factor n=1 Tax=Pedobacter sp. TaxID=1411316 RepID=UPI002BBE169D|nr:sigma-70 family RNA polymerase sigma factor [Pedobacter sp.]HMI02916.1 sigma-70 family RNA polymerase sigma factor [Pedobacter sp.]
MGPDSLYDTEDTELLAKLSEGSKPAFDMLYNRHWKQVFNAAYKRLNDEQQAQDIAQDVFVQLWIRGTKSPIENLSAYLQVAARNGVFKHFEKQGKLSVLPDAIEEVTDEHDRADAGMLHQEFLRSFNELVETLPQQQRIIFRMRFEEDLSSQQIADQLEISPKTVRNQLGRALTTLRTSLLVLQFLFMLYPGR